MSERCATHARRSLTRCNSEKTFKSTQRTMTITWLSNKHQSHQVDHPLIQKKDLEQWQSMPWPLTGGSATSLIEVGYDIENRSVFPCREGLLLSSFCYGDNILVVDNTSIDNRDVFPESVRKRMLFVCHNADHEARWGVATGFTPGRYACTMVNSRRLLAGQEGYRHDLVSVIIRYLGIEAVPKWMDKDIRKTFHECTFFTTEQVLYNAGDALCMVDLYHAQLREAERQGRLFELNSLRARLVPCLAEAEMTGILHDTQKWHTIAEERKQKADEICKNLTNTVVTNYQINPLDINPEARKRAQVAANRENRRVARLDKLKSNLKLLEESGKTHLKSYKLLLLQLESLQESSTTLKPGSYDMPTTTETSVPSVDRLVSMTNEQETTPIPINWSSSKQAITVLEAIGCPVPMKRDGKGNFKPSLGKEARNEWFTHNEDSPYKGLFFEFDKFKKTIHNVNAFGDGWVEKYVRANGRVYTMYHQSKTATGRFSCGDRENGYPNMQQIPKPKEYRECFKADPGRAILTLDFKNCEGIIMIALSGDLNLKKITELEDSHSYLGTKCWRNVYASRSRGNDKWKELSEAYEMNQTTEAKKKERDIFKNSGGLFPVAYGIHASKVSRAARVTEKEGQIFIDTIKAEIPKVIEFLDSKSREAITTGYVVHNKRTNSVRGFTPVLDQLHYGFQMSKSEQSEVEMAARNSPIQGSNADVIIETIVSIDLWKRLFKRDVRLLLQVHDELVYDCPADQVDYYLEKIKQIMQRTAQKYLIPEISMGVSAQHGPTWLK